tara:strand:- start:1011 stop:1310 length:300 start_codon:yes stop_codon:yes gene_type:complete
MGSIQRKIKRNRSKKALKHLQKKTKKMMTMYDHLPEGCTNCLSPFDKGDKEMVKTWSIVIPKDQTVVRLYCPTCWNSAKEILGDLKEHLEKKDKDEKSD